MSRRAGQFLALARAEIQAGWRVVAVTHHTTILALRALLERRAITDVVDEARKAKTPNGCVLRYDLAAGRFTLAGTPRSAVFNAAWLSRAQLRTTRTA